MQQFTDLAIILKTFPFQERDRIVVCLTEHHGKITGLAKGAISSRRFGGALHTLTCSRVRVVQKPHVEMGRIEEAVTYREFQNIVQDFARLSAASFAVEFCLRLLEPQSPVRDMFVLLSHVLFQLDEKSPHVPVMSTFLCKAFKILGYPPSLLRCVRCGKGAHECVGDLFYWNSQAGGIICPQCQDRGVGGELNSKLLLLYHDLMMTPFKKIQWDIIDPKQFNQLFNILMDFLKHHVPGLPPGGFESCKLSFWS